MYGDVENWLQLMEKGGIAKVREELQIQGPSLVEEYCEGSGIECGGILTDKRTIEAQFNGVGDSD